MFASTASPLAAACVAESAQPRVSGGYTVGILNSNQGKPRDLGVIRNMFNAASAHVRAARPSGVRTLSDADVANADAIRGLNVIVLPEAKGLSRAQRLALLSWVRAGGGLVSLYFDGRDDENGTPLIRKGFNKSSEWGELTPAFGATFVNDVFMTRARFALDGSNPLVARASAFCGGPIPDYDWRRGERPIALTGEMVTGASSAFRPVARLAQVKITYSPAERRAVPGSVFAFTNRLGVGRLVHFGFNFVDAWQPWTFQSYYRGVDPGAPNTGAALLRGSLDWAAGRA